MNQPPVQPPTKDDTVNNLQPVKKLQNHRTLREEEYLEMTKLLFHRHFKRGWNCAQMKEYILHSDMRLRQELQKPAAEPAAGPTATTSNGGKD